MSYTAGDAYVQFIPSFRGFAAAVKAEAEKAARQVESSLSNAVSRGLSGGTAGAGSQGGQAGAAYGQSFADTVRARVSAALKNLPSPKINVNSTEAEKKIFDLRYQLRSLQARVGVSIDSATALAEIGRITAELQALTANDPNVDVRVNSARATAQLASLQAELDALTDKTIDVRLEGGFAQRVKSQIEAALAELPEAQINANTDPAARKFEELRTRLTTLRDLRIGVDIDAGKAQSELAAVQAELVALGGKDATVDVRVDAARAEAALAAIQAEIAALDAEKVDIDTSPGIAGFGALLAAGLVLAPALIPIGAAIAAAFAGIAVATAGVVAAVGVIALALAPVIKAVMALSQAHKTAGVDAARSAKQQADAAYAVQSAQMQVAAAEKALAQARKTAAQQAVDAANRVKDAQQGVADAETRAAQDSRASAKDIATAQENLRRTRRDNAQQAIDDAKRVSDAERNLARVQVESARAIAAADQNVADAQRNAGDVERSNARSIADAAAAQVRAGRELSDAQTRQLQLQKDLTRAREDATRAMEDLNNAVKDGALDERQANQDLEDAKKALDAARDASGGLTDAQRQHDALLGLTPTQVTIDPEAVAKAQLAYDKAQQSLSEVQAKNARLVQEQSDAVAKGVDGSDQVVAAQAAVVQAQQSVDDATAASAKAQQDYAEAQRRAAEDTLVAQQNLADAQTSAAVARETAAQRELDATQAISDARAQQARDAQTAADRLGDALTRVSDAQASAAQQALDDQARIAKAQDDVTAAIRAQSRAQESSAYQVAQAQQAVLDAQRNAAHAAEVGMEKAATQTDKAKDALAGLSPAGQAFVKFLQDKLFPAFKGLSSAAQEGLLPGLQSGLDALLPAMPVITGLVGTLARTIGDLFAAGGKGLVKSPVWQVFFRDLAVALPGIISTMGHVIGDFASGLAGLFTAVLPLGLRFGDSVAGTAKTFADWAANLNSNAGFKGFLTYAAQSLPIVGGFIANLAGAIGSIVKVAAPFGAVLLEGLSAVLGFIAALPPGVIAAVFGALGLALLGIAVAASGILGPVALIAVGLTALGIALTYAWQHSETFRDIVTGTWDVVSSAVQTAWDSFLHPVFDAFVGLLGTIGSAAKDLWNNYISPAFAGIASAAKTAWDTVLSPIFSAWLKIMGVEAGALGYVAKWLCNNILVPAFTGIGDAVSGAWDKVIKPALDAFVTILGVGSGALGWVLSAVKATAELVWAAISTAVSGAWTIIDPLITAFLSAIGVKGGLKGLLDDLETGAKSVWKAIGTAVSDAWTLVISPIFESLKTALGASEGGLVYAFNKAASAIGSIWDAIKESVRAPMFFVLDTILNKGLLGGFNTLANLLHTDPIELIQIPDALYKGGKAPQGHAEGGLIEGPWMGPNADNVLARLNPREYVMPVSAVEHYGVDFMRAVHRGALPRFANGGLVGSVVGAGKSVLGAGKKIIDVISNPTDAFKGTVDSLIQKALSELGPGPLGQIAAAVPRMLGGVLVDKVKSLVGSILPGGGGTTATPPALPGDPGVMMKPSPGGYGLPWGNTYSGGRYHSGQDFLDPIGSPIVAALPGVVEYVKYLTGSYGKHVAIKHPGGWETLYAHMSDPKVITGQQVAEGQLIGLSGDTGNVTGPHLHFEVRTPPGGYSHAEDPRRFIGHKTYDSGGYLDPGFTLAYNGTGKPEPVFTGGQLEQMQSAASTRQGPTYHYYAAEGRSMAQDDFIESQARMQVLTAGWGQ